MCLWFCDWETALVSVWVQGKTVMWRRQSRAREKHSQKTKEYNQRSLKEEGFFLDFYETWKLYMTTLTMSVRRNEVLFTIASLLGQSILHLCFIASHEFQFELVINWRFRFLNCVLCVNLWFSLMSKSLFVLLLFNALACQWSKQGLNLTLCHTCQRMVTWENLQGIIIIFTGHETKCILKKIMKQQQKTNKQTGRKIVKTNVFINYYYY